MNTMTIPWPDSLVASVRAAKRFLGFFTGYTIAGVPLDLPTRFLFLGVLHLRLRRGLSFRASATSGICLLLAVELLELIAVRDPFHPHLPDLGDVVDLASGCAGILAAEALRRSRTWGKPSSSQS